MSIQFIEFPLSGNSGGAGSTVLADQGDPNTLANAWPVKLTDGVIVNTFNADGLRVSATGVATELTLSSMNSKIHESVISTGNSTSTLLGPGGTFIGTGVNVVPYSGIIIIFVTDRPGTLITEYSNDGISWDYTETYAIAPFSPGTPESFTFGVLTEASFFRIRYVNGGTAQLFFKMQTVLKTNTISGEVHQVSFAVTDRTEAQVTKSIIYGKTTGGGGGYVAVKVNPSGTQTVDASGSTVSITGTVTASDAGFVRANAPTRRDYTISPVTTAAYVQLVAATTLATKEIELFDSSGQTMMLATGAAAAEVDQMLIFPGGNGRVKLAIPAGTRVSIKAVSGLADVGEISINFYG